MSNLYSGFEIRLGLDLSFRPQRPESWKLGSGKHVYYTIYEIRNHKLIRLQRAQADLRNGWLCMEKTISHMNWPKGYKKIILNWAWNFNCS